MRRYVAIVVSATAAVLIGGGFVLAQGFDIVLALSGSTDLSWGRATTYATHVSEEWTPTTDTLVCDMRVKISQQTGDRSQDIAWTIRRGMTTNPETGGDVILEGTIQAPDIPTVADDVYFGTGECWIATSGTKYGIDFYTGMDATNYLHYYYGGDQIANGQNWDYVPVTGWTARPTRELAMSLFGTTDSSQFAAYSSSTYGFNDPDFGTFGNAIVDISKWLFVPSAGALNILATQRDALMTKPPFAWAATASSTLGGLNTGDSTTSTAIVWTASTTQMYQEIELFSPADVASKIPEDIQNLIRTIGAVLMWAMFFAWIVSLATSGHVTDHVGIQTPGPDDVSGDLGSTDAVDLPWMDNEDFTGSLDAFD